MGRSVDADVRQKWVWRMQRFARARQTVAAFCDLEQVSVAAFYQWRRKLAEQAAAVPSVLSHAGRTMPSGFVPVKLLQPLAVEVLLVNGVRLTLPVSDLDVLRQTLRIVSQLPRETPPSQEGESC